MKLVMIGIPKQICVFTLLTTEALPNQSKKSKYFEGNVLFKRFQKNFWELSYSEISKILETIYMRNLRTQLLHVIWTE